MVGWIILGVILALILLILLIPVGVDLGYESGLLHLSAKVGPAQIQLFPRQKKEKKEPKEKKPKKKKKKEEPKEEKEEEPKEKKKRSLPFDRDEILELLQVALKALGKFGRAWKVERFVFHFVSAGKDPYDTAMLSGYMDAAIATLAPLCRRRFAVRDSSVWTDVDFTADWPSLDLGLAMTITLWKIFGVVNCLLFGALKVLLKSKRRRKKEAKALKEAGGPPDDTAPGDGPDAGAAETADPAAADETAAAPDTEMKNIERPQAEERMEANG